MTKDLKYLIKIVKQAAKMVTDEFMINAKDENNDLITDFDIEIEKFLLNKLNSRYPDLSLHPSLCGCLQKDTAYTRNNRDTRDDSNTRRISNSRTAPKDLPRAVCGDHFAIHRSLDR